MQLKLLENEAVSEERADLSHQHRRRLARSAEHLVCCDVLERGFDALIAAEGLPYDVVADIGGLRRIQVKSTLLRNRPVAVNGKEYDYEVYRFKSKVDLREKYVGSVDLMAFVALDPKLILYMRPEQLDGGEVRINPIRMGRDFCDLSWTDAIRGWS